MPETLFWLREVNAVSMSSSDMNIESIELQASCECPLCCKECMDYV